MKTRPPGARMDSGFTLVEMMVVIVLFSILTVLAFPAMTDWVRNSRVRAVADVLQNSLRLAQAEALRRSRQTIFTYATVAAPASQSYSVNTVPLMTDDLTTAAATLVETGALSSPNSGVQVAGPTAICFNSLGRLVQNTTAGCPAPNSPTRFNITLAAGGGRPMQVLVSLGGQVRMCDPGKVFSTANPDGCP